MKLENSRVRSLLRWIALAACLLALLSAIRTRMKPVATNHAAAPTSEPKGSLPSASDIFAATPRRGSRVAAEPSPNELAVSYESEDFTHVPDWIPRPQHAIAAAAEDATLRSDGFLEGTVRLIVAGTAEEADDWIRKSLAAAGLQSDPGSSSFVSPSPAKRCDVNIEIQSPARTLVTLRYEASDHGNACACPSCGHGD
jgi:hypothetical protein